ncbi:phosphoglycerate mutase-like protein [Xylariaceae sp. FL0594]|nr:phosphoglycerate mutase-like protein [Xylariaceae sp. FL0594]
MGLKAILLSLATLPLAKTETVLGVFIFSRHGDRTPKVLAPTKLTSLGAEQVYASGSYYRSRYVASDAASPILGLESDVVALSQLSVTAPVDNVLQSSAQAFLQGLYPPAGRLSAQELANETSVTAPLGGYQYIPVNAVADASAAKTTTTTGNDAENNAWLQGNSGCSNAVVSSNNYFSSAEYAATLAESADLYSRLRPVLDGVFDERAATFKNAYAIWDYVHAATIHNKTNSDVLTDDTLLRELRRLSDMHEWNLAYNSSDTIRAVAGQTLAGQVLDALNATVVAATAAAAGQGKKKDSVKLNIQFGAYGVFSSFFGLAQLPLVSDEFTGVVDYASSMAFELVATTSTSTSTTTFAEEDISVRFLFSNGVGSPPRYYPLFGQPETTLPWTRFAEEMGRFAIRDAAGWCEACGNGGACAKKSSSGSVSPTSDEENANGISLATAGVIGALVTLAVVLGAEALIYLFSGLRLVREPTLASTTAAQAYKA